MTVRAYTNAASCELFLDGASLGSVTPIPFAPAEWVVPYRPGKLSVVAYDAAGNVAATDVQETTGTPVALRLRLENADDLTANGYDLAIFTCYAVDAEGREVPDSTIEQAAIIAAYNSKGRDSSLVPVDYTEIRNVKKPSGAAPGKAVYEHYKTAYVRPAQFENYFGNQQ